MTGVLAITEVMIAANRGCNVVRAVLTNFWRAGSTSALVNSEPTYDLAADDYFDDDDDMFNSIDIVSCFLCTHTYVAKRFTVVTPMQAELENVERSAAASWRSPPSFNKRSPTYATPHVTGTEVLYNDVNTPISEVLFPAADSSFWGTRTECRGSAAIISVGRIARFDGRAEERYWR